MTFLKRSTSSLLAYLQAAGGESLTYCFDSIDIPVIGIKTEAMVMVETFSGQHNETKITDWIIKGSDLQIGGEEIEPEEGNQIFYGDEVYEVYPVGNQKPWEYVDPYKTILRVHSLLREVLNEQGY